MPVFNISCDITQGFKFHKDCSSPVGFITELNVGGKAMAADFTCKDPENPDADLKVVAVLSQAHWGTGVTDTMLFAGQISIDNRQAMEILTYKLLNNVEVDFKFRVYDYDPKAKKYFRCFHANDAELKGLLEKNGDDLSLTVASDPSSEVESPLNYTFRIGIKSQLIAQGIVLATADRMSVTKSWGMNVG
jgi:hypothetical protein